MAAWLIANINLQRRLSGICCDATTIYPILIYSALTYTHILRNLSSQILRHIHDFFVNLFNNSIFHSTFLFSFISTHRNKENTFSSTQYRVKFKPRPSIGNDYFTISIYRRLLKPTIVSQSASFVSPTSEIPSILEPGTCSRPPSTILRHCNGTYQTRRHRTPSPISQQADLLAALGDASPAKPRNHAFQLQFAASTSVVQCSSGDYPRGKQTPPTFETPDEVFSKEDSKGFSMKTEMPCA